MISYQGHFPHVISRTSEIHTFKAILSQRLSFVFPSGLRQKRIHWLNTWKVSKEDADSPASGTRVPDAAPLTRPLRAQPLSLRSARYDLPPLVFTRLPIHPKFLCLRTTVDVWIVRAIKRVNCRDRGSKKKRGEEQLVEPRKEEEERRWRAPSVEFKHFPSTTVNWFFFFTLIVAREVQFSWNANR